MASGRKRKLLEEEEVDLRWEWEGDSGSWMVYSAEHAQAMAEAFRNRAPSLLLHLSPTTSLWVDLRKMVQRNVQTGFERRVRCAVRDEDDYYVWQWENVDRMWQPYDTETCQELERTWRSKRSGTVTCSIGRTRYVLDPGRMRQFKSRSKEEHNMGRLISGTTRTLLVKGKAAVDSGCREKQGKAHVYCEGDVVYDALLNQTNLQFNNNKFYIIQLLQDDDRKLFSVWMRWGRVGKAGQNSLVPCGADLQKAKEIFEKKFHDKTKNEWSQRLQFVKVAGKYDMLTLDYGHDSSAEREQGENSRGPKVKSRLDPRLQELMALICDLNSMEEMMLQMKYDTKKAPLGKLTINQIKAGYSSLRKIEDYLNRKVSGRALLEACNEFYTRIPHDFGLKTPPIICSRKELQEKISLLEALSDIEVAISMIKSEPASAENPLDQHYRFLHCELQPMDHSCSHFQIIEKYLQSTHASTHNDYTMKLLEVFQVAREGEEEVFRSDLNNRRLLWHGSRLMNWVSILNQGLRIAPPEAPVTGYMFGKGIYFADMSSKSANYCFATREQNVGLLLLCEVALGDCHKLLAADYEASSLPQGKDSTMGLGRVAPSDGTLLSLDGVLVPMGPARETGVVNPDGYTLNYNEYVVYDPAQVRMKYLLKVQFHHLSLW
ncbi:poly [ADP-ribose] polymerase 2 isoform X2 [Narcine bancroftii]|uniref:poly [ADP-ribose] polymerase 2 isoform X2 n=1 Tax=Narcine bancroftii TaxID=1343680 RepID=UPI003832184F